MGKDNGKEERVAKRGDDEVVVKGLRTPVERVESYLDEARELVDEAEVVADDEVAADSRREFRAELTGTAKALHKAHAKVAAVVKASGGKLRRERKRRREEAVDD